MAEERVGRRGTVEPPYYRLYGQYAGAAPCLYPRSECPWLDSLERNWAVIRQEFEDYHYAQGNPLAPSFIPDPEESAGWRAINLLTYGRRYHDHCRHFPKTLEILGAIPHVTSVFLNLLEPHSAVPPHNGDSNTTYRCHLGLIIPGDVEQCGLQVGDQRRGWREGEAFAFCDAHPHFVWNDTDADRAILVVDVMKPEYRSQERRICARVLAAIAVVMIRTQLPWMRALPAWATRSAHAALGLAVGLYLPLQRRLRFL